MSMYNGIKYIYVNYLKLSVFVSLGCAHAYNMNVHASLAVFYLLSQCCYLAV